MAAHGFNGALWKSTTGSSNLAFVRPNGDKSNIPLDGTSTVMGTATWATLPDAQTILLHINDPVVCSSLYPSTSPYTCYVKPSEGAVCNQGDTTVAYNANPFGVLHCPKFALGFEADSVNEFGDRVTFATGGTSATLNVVFASYACQTSGHWNTGDCVSADPPGTYNLPTGHDFTAKLYSVKTSGCGALPTPCTDQELGTATLSGATTPIPFRPSADTTGPCAGTGQFFDPLAPAGSQCNNAKAFFLTFTFNSLSSAVLANQNVVWTVAFDTTHSGYKPIINDTPTPPSCTSNSDPGCGWDALNVGYFFYTGAPYAGIAPDGAEAFESTLSNPTLQSTTTWPDFGETGRPLGEITTAP